MRVHTPIFTTGVLFSMHSSLMHTSMEVLCTFLCQHPSMMEYVFSFVCPAVHLAAFVFICGCSKLCGFQGRRTTFWLVSAPISFLRNEHSHSLVESSEGTS